MNANRGESNAGKPGRWVVRWGVGGGVLKFGLGSFVAVGLEEVPDLLWLCASPNPAALGAQVGGGAELDAGTGYHAPDGCPHLVRGKVKPFRAFDSAREDLKAGAEGALVEVGHRGKLAGWTPCGKRRGVWND